jgi:hypothetical protein
LNKKRIVQSLIILSLFCIPLFLKSNELSHSYPSAYPSGGFHDVLIWEALNLLGLDSTNETHPFYLLREEIIALPVNYFDVLNLAQEDYDSLLYVKREHYWDPENLVGLYGNVGAPTHAQDYFDKAVNCYLGINGFEVNKTAAYYYLGYAIHLLQDVTVPHHAKNDPLGYHIDYESFCNYQFVFGNVPKPSNGIYTPPKDWEGKINAKAWVHQAALYASPYWYTIEGLGYDYNIWLNVATTLIGYAIKLTAGFLFYFWQLVQNLDYDNDTLDAVTEDYYNCDYTSNDSDGDLITDQEEISFGTDGWITNPASADTDFDGYTDYNEIHVYFTSPIDKFDSPYYFTPLMCRNFRGLSNEVNKITFSWSQPENYLPGWSYKLFMLTGSSETVLYTGVFRTFTYMPSPEDFISYRVYCYKAIDNRGIYAHWSGSVFNTNVEVEDIE